MLTYYALYLVCLAIVSELLRCTFRWIPIICRFLATKHKHKNKEKEFAAAAGFKAGGCDHFQTVLEMAF